MTETVIFDLDGLLVDSEITWYQVTKDLVESYGGSFLLEEYVKNHSGKTIVDNAELFRTTYHIPLDRETIAQNMKAAESRYVGEGIPLKKGARELLSFLKENGYRVLLGSSSEKERAIRILESNQVDGYFDDIVVGYDVKRSKPFPDIFLLAAKRAGSKPENCLVLEDSAAGIQAADAAGIPVICIPDLKKPGEEDRNKTKAVLPSLEDVIDYLLEEKKMEDKRERDGEDE